MGNMKEGGRLKGIYTPGLWGEVYLLRRKHEGWRARAVQLMC